MRFETPGIGPTVELAPAQSQPVPVRIRVPDDAEDGDTVAVNVRAEDATGRLAGGVTFLLRVQA